MVLTSCQALKNADSLLHDVLEAVDTSGDGQIQYNGLRASPAYHLPPLTTIAYTEFRVFVNHTERELWQLFESIDRDHNGALDKNELRAAFSRSGLAISSSKLDQFFEEVDTNHDGEISFEEWRYSKSINMTLQIQLLIMLTEIFYSSYRLVCQICGQCSLTTLLLAL